MKVSLLDQSLCMLKGISSTTECMLRRRGFVQKKQLVTMADTLFSQERAVQIRNSYSLLEKAQQLHLFDCLVNAFPCGHRVRVLHDYFQNTAFLDIETNGITNCATITCISILMNGQMSTFIRGKNLFDFLEPWKKCGMLVTFNGKKFDIPRIASEFNLSTIPAHVDLMNEAAHYGLKGGLKKITESIGFKRRDNRYTSGNDAVSLWNEYSKTGNENALLGLISYNQDDVYALTFLYQKLLRLSLENTLIKNL